MKSKTGIIYRVLVTVITLLVFTIGLVSCTGQQAPATNEAQPTKSAGAANAITVTASTTAYLEEPGSRSGTYLTFSVGKFHVANVNVDSQDEETKEFIRKLVEQINTGTAGGNISVNVGSNALPLENDTWLNTDIHLVNNPIRDSSNFMGPKGNVSFNGSVKARKGFDVDNFHVTNPGTSKVDISITSSSKAGEIITSHATPVAWDVPGWEWGSLTVTINSWNSTPAKLQQLQNAGIVTNRIQYDAIANIVSATQQVTIK